MTNYPALITLVTYSAILVAIGLSFARRATSEDSFLVGERKLGPLIVGLAYAASSSSAWVLLGFSGFVYSVGLSALWMVPGILAGYAAVWLWAGRILQSDSHKLGLVTFSDFLTIDCSPGTSRLIRVAASLMIAFCFSYYVASQFQGAGKAFDDLFSTGMVAGVLLGAAIILVYVLLGGFLAISVVDTLQGILIGCVAIALPVLAFFEAGGFSGIGQVFNTAPASYSDTFGNRTGWIAGGFALGMTATGFGALGQPHLVTWIMAARDTRSRVVGAGVAIGWAAIVYGGMAILGLCARTLLDPQVAPESIFFRLTAELLPGMLSGIVAAATLSAIMSTVDSQLLVAGAAISHDLGLARKFRGRDIFVTRLSILSVCVAAVIITLTLPSTIFERTLFAWTALGASFGPTLVARVLRHRSSGTTILFSMLIGFALSVSYEWLLPPGPGSVWARIAPWAGAFVPHLISRLFKGASTAP